MRLLLMILLVLISCAKLKSGARVKKHSVGNCYGNLCETLHKEYPIAKMKTLLKNYTHSNIAVGKAVIAPLHKELLSNDPVLMRSSTVVTREGNMCGTKKRTIFPKFDRSSQFAIVNIKSVYEQKLSLELCTKEFGSCQPDINILNYKTSCKQIYISLRLLSMHIKNNTLHFQPFKIPHGCVCFYETNLVNRKENRK